MNRSLSGAIEKGPARTGAEAAETPGPGAAPKPAIRASWLSLASGAVLALALWVVLDRAGHWPAEEAWRQVFSASDLYLLLIVLAGLAASVLIRALRWHALMGYEAPVGRRDALLVFPWLFLLKSLSPLRMGDLLRPLWVVRRGGSFGHAMGSVLNERTADLLALAVLAAVGWAATARGAGTFAAVLVIAAALSGYGGAILVSPRLHAAFARAERREHDRAGGGKRWRRQVLGGMSTLVTSFVHLRNPGRIFRFTALTILIWTIQVSVVYLFLAAKIPGLGLAAGPLFVLGVNAAGIISPAVGNVGSYQLAAIAALGLFGVPAGDALVISVALHAATILSTLLLGLLSRTLSAAFRIWP